MVRKLWLSSKDPFIIGPPRYRYSFQTGIDFDFNDHSWKYSIFHFFERQGPRNSPTSNPRPEIRGDDLLLAYNVRAKHFSVKFECTWILAAEE